jgi:DNA-binding MarR family transcriptional regulator
VRSADRSTIEPTSYRVLVSPEPDLLPAVRAMARASRVLERSCGELSLPHYRVLAAVAAGDERASRLARRLALGKPTISAAVESLTARGYLRRSAVTEDQRAIALSVTQDGSAALARAESAMTERLAALLAWAERPDQVASALAALEWALDRMAESAAAGVGR